MKTLICFLSFSLLPIAYALGQDNLNSPFVGIWEMVEMSNTTIEGTVVEVPAGYYKVFGADGSYFFMQWNRLGSRYVQEGTFSVRTDNSYAERIERALNKRLEGREFEIQYRFTDQEIMVIEGVVDGVAYTERWRKVTSQFPGQPTQ
ncbi:protein of unknown function [Parapedobacter composti]|uniref:DUF4488 domain-containing protein n=1 Tax=Parapedobacter composti TaxID=623281 RepID=A0A1I1J7A1_9SPHI|nr:DUF4488 domain-containing protein [Parapedobacter composti]SFC44424.1 protein of unknown function [Parapedobacter composti]